MRIAIVSDIHGNLPALQAVAAEIEAGRFDTVLNLGDIASGPLWPRETVAWLAERGWPTICGNHERQALAAEPGPHDDDAFAAAELGPAERAWLAALPATLDAAEGRVHAFHGIPGDDLHGLLETVVPGFGHAGSPGRRAAAPAEIEARLAGPGRVVPPAAEALLCGHTHVPRAVWHASRLLLNPGSLGRPAYAHDVPHRHVVETGSPHARWAVLEPGPAGWQVQLRLSAYDWEASARRAERLGFVDWAHELRTGRARMPA